MDIGIYSNLILAEYLYLIFDYLLGHKFFHVFIPDS